jgi:hypothetical protein
MPAATATEALKTRLLLGTSGDAQTALDEKLAALTSEEYAEFQLILAAALDIELLQVDVNSDGVILSQEKQMGLLRSRMAFLTGIQNAYAGNG